MKSLSKILCMGLLLIAGPALSKDLVENKVQLQDVSIKGEANNLGLNLLSRARNNLNGRINLRTTFRDRTLEDLPATYKSAAFKPK